MSAAGAERHGPAAWGEVAPGGGVRFSRRTSWDLDSSRFAGRLEVARAAGHPLLDLAEANPTRCGLAWPEEELVRLLASPGALGSYEPNPRGPLVARAAVARLLAGRGAEVDPDRIFLTASTSEAYAFLLQLLCDPGDEVLVPAPSYPLLEVLAGLAGVAVRRYPLRLDARWQLDLAAVERAVTSRTRAVLTISPGNPTGAALSAGELAGLEELCARAGLALVGDEVFAESAPGCPSVAGARRCLAFHLSGLSKVCGLPQLKVAWLAAAGPAPEVEEATRRLEMIADAFLSVSGPSALALPALLGARERFLGPLRARLAGNRAALSRVALGAPYDLLASEGGWSAVLRLGQTVDEEALALALLEEDGVVVQPGYFYDLERPGHLVLSLLPRPAVFEAGLARVDRRLRRLAEGALRAR